MKQFFLTCLLIAVMSIIASCQYTLSGTVTDQSNADLLAGASVIIENTFIGTITDDKGQFIITNLKKGIYAIRISFIGYQSVTHTVELTSNHILNTGLEKSHVLEETVIVTATNALEKYPATFKNINNINIEKLNLGKDLPLIIDNAPSVVTTSDAGSGIGYTNLRIRGSDITRINVTMNGIPMNDPESQLVFFVDLPDFASSIDNVQIIRGVGTSVNGAAAFGASINIQTMKLKPLPYCEINNSFGSFNTIKNNILFGTGLIHNKWSFDGRLSNLSSDGYIDRASAKLTSYFLSGSYNSKNSILKLNVFSGKEKTYQAWSGVPQDSLKTNRTYNPFTYQNQTDNYKQDHYQLILSRQFFNKWNLNAAMHYTHGEGYYEEYIKDADFASYLMDTLVINDSIITRTSLVRQQWLSNDFYGFTYSLHFDNKKKIKFTLGGALNQYNGDHFGKVIWATYASNSDINKKYYDNNGLKNDANVFGKLVYSVTDIFDIFIDMQYRKIIYHFDGIDQYLNNVRQKAVLDFINPKAGIHLGFNRNNSIYASYCVGNKEPDRNDYIASTAESRPKYETLYDFEAGYRYITSKINIHTDVYYMDYKNQLVLTGKINDVGEYTRTNIDKSYRTGVEADVSVLLNRKLKFSANGAYSINKILNFTEYLDDYSTGIQQSIKYNNTDIAFSPSVVAYGEIDIYILKNLSLVISEKYVSRQFLDNTSNPDRVINEYFTTDLRMHYKIKTNLFREIGLNVIVNNLFNKMYESNGWTYSYIYENEVVTENAYFPQAGINFLAGVSLKF